MKAPKSPFLEAGSQDENSKSNQIEVPSVSLPKGGGAVKGIDEKFRVNPANGTASLSLPLPLSHARSGFVPAISLTYNSGAGNGLFGIGWDLGFPSIQRKTDKLLPRYLDHEESDVFLLAGAEDLVPLLVKGRDGQLVKDEFRQDGYTIRRFLPRIEGGFSRIERITHANGMWWKVTSHDNVTTFFGKTSAYRITDPKDSTRIFQWLPELSFDNKGNCVLYQFKQEDGFGMGVAIQDANRFNPDGTQGFVQSYLKRVFYCPRHPFRPALGTSEEIYQTQNPPAEGFLMELVLDYGEHGTVPDGRGSAVNVSYQEEENWKTRSDAYSSYRSGFEIRTARLCHRVLMFHHMPQLGTVPCLIRSLDLNYSIGGEAYLGGGTSPDGAGTSGDLSGRRSDSDAGSNLDLTYLVSATQRSYLRSSGSEIEYRHRCLPPLEFRYQELTWDKTVQEVSDENAVHAPAGLGSGYQWVDLNNEGIPGILTEQGNGWFYKSNLGDGEFTPALPVVPKPSLSGMGSGVLQLQDLEADGRKQLVVNGAGLNGYFELNAEQGWEPFRAFEKATNLDLSDPNVRLIDLNGDGRPEIVVSEEQAFRWYPSLGVLGYDGPELASKPFDEEQGPAMVFADGSQSIFLADMSGDGLTDIVRIRNGELCYWPNLGYGRFGAKVTMKDSPWMDLPDQFNPGLIQLADVSGTGATDLLYLGQDRFRVWLNLCGNAWSEVCEIAPFPSTAQPNSVTVTDFLGTGTACIVCSSPLPGAAPLKYIDLMGGKKPHVMTSYRNNLGAETSWEYKSSTHYYLADKKAGRPWVTKLPFPVQVLSRVTVRDKWRGTTFSNTYSYHHGYYDHAEREFRGFGRVEQVDVEKFGTFAATNAESTYVARDKTLSQPPVKTVTWYHTGAFLGRDRILSQFSEEYFRPEGGSFREHSLPEPDIDQANLDAITMREALRACKGMVLRQEVYELDLDELEEGRQVPVKLFSTAFHNCHLKLLQPRLEQHAAAFIVTEGEAITYHYEFDLRHDAFPDPRISHRLNLAFNEYGQTLQAVAIGYRRWQDVDLVDELLRGETKSLIRSVQAVTHITYTENQFTNAVTEQHHYRVPMPADVKTFELTQLHPASGFYFTLAELRAANIRTALTEIQYHALPDPELAQKRLVEHVRTYYFADIPGTALPWRVQNHLALPFETYKVALSDGLLTAILGDQLNALAITGESDAEMRTRVLSKGGYHFEDGLWWIKSGIAGFQVDAAAQFYLPDKFTDPFGQETRLAYDADILFIEQTIDPFGNTVAVIDFDYRVMAPRVIEDINHNRTAVAYDILGMPCAVATMGKDDDRNHTGDSVTGIETDPSLDSLTGFFIAEAWDEARALTFLGTATARHLYYLGEEVDADGHLSYGNHPPCAAGILRERHVSRYNLNKVQVALEYSDGTGNILVTKNKAEAEAGTTALRWIASGKTILNNKGKPVKQYEPYFTTYHGWSAAEAADEVGVTAMLYYDAPGRLIRTVMPDKTLSRVVFTPWFTQAWDANDTVLESEWFRDKGGEPLWTGTEPVPHEPELRAAFLASVHANTPTETHLDGLGREVMVVAHNRWRNRRRDDTYSIEDAKYVTYTKLDTEGKPLWIQDARGNRVMEYIVPAGEEDDGPYSPAYDIAGNLLYQHSMDAGDRWMLMDAAGKPYYAWDFNERVTAAGVVIPEHRIYHTEYDALRRPLNQLLKINDGDWQTVEQLFYGEFAADATLQNLKGQLIQHNDPSGILIHERYDVQGKLELAKRQLISAYEEVVFDWGGPALSTRLMAEIFTQTTAYDALGRMRRLENWHREGQPPAVYVPLYNDRGVLLSEELTVHGELTPAIELIEYNEKGQRTLIRYGNKTTTRYSYDDKSFRLLQLRTTVRGVDSSFPSGASNLSDPNVLQNLYYTYDPVGNITEILDDAYEPVFFHNQMVEPRSKYEYDAHYRLIKAEGREQVTLDSAPSPRQPELRPQSIPRTDQALRNYCQTYHYDAVGNIREMRHRAGNGSITQRWSRKYDYEETSNRLIQTTQRNGGTSTIAYTYDTHGSMLNFVASRPEVHTRWDYRDMIHHLNLEGGGWAWYNYDSQKQRCRKRVMRSDGSFEERIYLGGMEWYRRIRGSAVVEEIETHFMFADDQRVLIVEDVLVSDGHLPVDVLFRYQYGNHLGSVGLEVSGDGDVISYEEYHPYGTTAYTAVNAEVQAAFKRYRYTGMERDEESGLAYHTARYYLPWLGRWGSADPIGVEGGMCLWEYTKGRPINRVDPTGLQCDPNNSVADNAGNRFSPLQVFIKVRNFITNFSLLYDLEVGTSIFDSIILLDIGIHQTSDDADAVDAFHPTWNTLHFRPSTLGGSVNLSVGDLQSWRGIKQTIARMQDVGSLIHESTHALIDNLQEREDVEFLQVQRDGHNYYRDKLLENGERVSNVERVFLEAAAEYVEQRIVTYLATTLALILLNFEYEEGRHSDVEYREKIEEIRSQHRESLEELNFGYQVTSDGGQRHTTAPISESLRDFLNRRFLSAELDMPFDDVESFQQLIMATEEEIPVWLRNN